MQNYGLQHFDHLGGALLILAQYTIPDGAYDPLHYALESEPGAVGITWLLFLSITCFGTFIILGLVLAVINETFRESLREASKVDHHHGPTPQLQAASLEPAAHQPGTRSLLSSGRSFFSSWARKTIKEMSNAFAIVILLQSAVTMAYVQDQQMFQIPYLLALMLASAAFIFELALRLGADGILPFVRNSFNWFEGAMVLCGIAGLRLSSTALGLITILRLYRLMSFFPAMNGLLLNLLSTRQTFLQLVMFAGLSLLSFAVLGRYIFRGSVGQLIPSNFDNLGQALLTTFQMFTGDQWR